MKKYFHLVFCILFSLFLLFNFSSCNFWTDADLTIKRIKDHLDLKKSETDSNYQYAWYIFKYDDVEINKGDSVSIELTGTPENVIPEILGYLVEYKDPTFKSRKEAKKALEDKNYVATPSEYIKISPKKTVVNNEKKEVEFKVNCNFTLDFDIVDKDKTYLLLYLNPETLSEDYFDYMEKKRDAARSEAKKEAQKKADKINKREKLSSGDSGYHKASEYYEEFETKLLNEIGENRIIINDVKLKVEVRNN